MISLVQRSGQSTVDDLLSNNLTDEEQQQFPGKKTSKKYFTQNKVDYRRLMSAMNPVMSKQHYTALKTTAKGAITSKIKHAIKLKTSPARLAQLLQPSLGRPFTVVTGGLIKCS